MREQLAGATMRPSAKGATARAPPPSETSMGIAAFLYGVMAYAIFLGTILYGIGFIGDFLVPKSIDSPPFGAWPESLFIDLLLLGLFAVQHSTMARPAFKALWTRVVPESVERSTYVLISSLLLALLFWQWRPLGGTVWDVQDPLGRGAIQALSALGWLVLFASTFMINHFDLFGLRQVYLRLRDEPYRPLPFVTVALYRFIRHPIMLGFLIAFWSAPTMTLGHLVFAGACTAYIFIGIWLEERDLRRAHGASYERYREQAGMVLPRVGRGATAREGKALGAK